MATGSTLPKKIKKKQGGVVLKCVVRRPGQEGGGRRGGAGCGGNAQPLICIRGAGECRIGAQVQ